LTFAPSFFRLSSIYRQRRKQCRFTNSNAGNATAFLKYCSGPAMKKQKRPAPHANQKKWTDKCPSSGEKSGTHPVEAEPAVLPVRPPHAAPPEDGSNIVAGGHNLVL
jgi:hypothetical protein